MILPSEGTYWPLSAPIACRHKQCDPARTVRFHATFGCTDGRVPASGAKLAGIGAGEHRLEEKQGEAACHPFKG